MSSERVHRAPDGVLADFIRAERVRYVFLQSGFPTFLSPLAAAVMSAALWHVVDHRHLMIWTSGVAVLATTRYLLIHAYKKRLPNIKNVRAWERGFVASVLAVAAWWGGGGLLFLGDSLPERILVFCFLMLMAGGSAASYAAHPPTVTLTTLALAMPVTLHFALVDDVLHRSLAVASVMYVAALIRSIRTLGEFFARTHKLAHELEAERVRAERMARTDHLTRLNNRRAFYELADAAVRHARRYGHPVSLVIFDIDHFKSINDSFGHSVGDDAIRALAEMIRGEFRDTDITCRFGGEEFCVLLPETDLEDALATAERFRVGVGSHVFEHGDVAIRFKVSLGVAALSPEQSLDQLIDAADAELYSAKRAGRNRVMPSVRPVEHVAVREPALAE